MFRKLFFIADYRKSFNIVKGSPFKNRFVGKIRKNNFVVPSRIKEAQ